MKEYNAFINTHISSSSYPLNPAYRCGGHYNKNFMETIKIKSLISEFHQKLKEVWY
jgi:hypothetical protein